MSRRPNSTDTGGNFSKEIIDAVWDKAGDSFKSAPLKIDACGVLIAKSDYGDTSKIYGWEIDHIRPVSKGGTDILRNLQALHWQNNRHKSDNWPTWDCKVGSK